MYIEWYYYQVQASNLVQRSMHLFQNRSLIQFSGDEQQLNAVCALPANGEVMLVQPEPVQ